MATYTAACSQVGSFSYAKYFTLYVVLTDRDGSSSTNKSQVDYNVYCQSSGSGSISANHQLYFELNGNVIRNENVYVNVSSPNAYISIASGTLANVLHNDNGSKSISFGASISATGGYGVSARVSGTFTLNTIARYATSNQSLKSKTSSSITMNWSSDNTIDYIWYSKDGGSSWTGIDVTDGTSGSYTISGLSASTTYSIKTRVRRKDSQLTTDSSASSITTYAKTTPTISLSSKTINSITVTSSCNVAVSSTQYRIKTSSGSYGSYQKSATFSGLTYNTTYIIEVYKVGSESGESGIATLSVTTYDIAKISSYPNFNLGSSEKIGYSNPSGSALAIAMYATDGTTVLCAYRTASGSSYTFSFTDTELDTLYKKFGTTNTITIRVYLRTTCNSVNYYNYKTITVTLVGNQKTGHIKLNDAWKRSKKWININGTWKQCVRWINVNGTWKRCI